MATDGVDFIYKDDAGGIFLALLEKVAHSGCANADEHFDKIRSTDREERHIRFTRDSTCKQGFSRSRGSDQQNTFRNSAAKLLKLLRFLQKIDDFLQFFLRFLDPGDIFKRHLLLMRREQAGPALAEGQGLVASALHLPHEE